MQIPSWLLHVITVAMIAVSTSITAGIINVMGDNSSSANQVITRSSEDSHYFLGQVHIQSYNQVHDHGNMHHHEQTHTPGQPQGHEHGHEERKSTKSVIMRTAKWRQYI